MPQISVFCRRLLLSLAICATLIAAAAPASAAPPGLPFAIRQSLRDSGDDLVSAVAADVDADGDLDVVATDGSLDLLVFVNDGNGRYTRREPAPTRDEHTQAPAPGLESHQPFTDVYTAAAPPVLDAEVRGASFDPCPSCAVAGLAADPAVEHTILRRRPRGPPDGSSLI
jgi:hypothetical protein